ncbi:5994_t:CDS:2, partial [Paraglomus occultum]
MAAPRDPCLYKETPLVLNSFSPESPITYTINANSSQTTRAPVEPASYQRAEQGSILRLNNDIQGYIFWQVVDAGCVLNLRYISLTDGENTTPTLDQTGPVFPVQFSFGGQIVPKVAFFEGVGIVLCLVLVKDILYRLRLPLKDTFAKLRTLQDRQPCIITVLDYNNFVVGCRDGAMFNYNYDAIRTQQLRQASPHSIEDTFSETELAEPLIKQLKNLGSLLMYYGKRSQSELDDNSYSDSSSFQPISMASHIDGSVKFIVSLSRDRRIKVCSLPTGEHLDDRPLKSAGVMDNSDSEDDESVNNDANFDESTADQGDDNIRISDLPPQSKSYICILGGGAKFSKTFNFLVYVPYLDSGLFALYRVRYEQKGTLKSLDIIGQIRCTADEFLKENARAHAFVKLVDIVAVKKFENKIESPFDNSVGTQVWTLWTLWDRAGRATIAYTDLKITFFKSLTEPSECVAGGVSIHGASYRQNWMIVAHPLPERLNPTQFLKDTDNAEVINEEFLEYTLIPGRFSAAIIQSSLMSFITESSDLQLCKRKSQLLLDARDIRDKVKDYVTGHVVRQHDPETGLIRESQYIENLQAEWIRFLSKCHQFLEDAQKPVSLMVDASSKFFSIIKKHGISVLCLCEALEVIHQHFEGEHNGDRLESISVDAFIPQYECLVDERERVDVIRIFKAADFVASRFQSDIISLEEQLVEGLLGVQEDPTITVAVNFYTQFMIKNIGEHSETIWSIVKSTGKWRKCVRSIIEMLSGVLEDKRIPDAEYTSSIFANALYASSTQQVIQTRYKISRNILLLLITIASSPYNDELMGTRKLLGSAMMTYYTQRLLMWMSKQCIPPSTSQEDNSEDNIIEKFS